MKSVLEDYLPGVVLLSCFLEGTLVVLRVLHLDMALDLVIGSCMEHADVLSIISSFHAFEFALT